MDQWRRVTVDDRIPVDVFGAPLLVGSMPAQLWPLILSKAILKLMALYQVHLPVTCCLLPFFTSPILTSSLHVCACTDTM